CSITTCPSISTPFPYTTLFRSYRLSPNGLVSSRGGEFTMQDGVGAGALNSVRRLPAIALAFVMVASIGVVPVQAVATAVVGTSALNWAHLANAFGDRAQPITDLGLTKEMIPLGLNARGPVEMVVSLEGNSLAAEQQSRIDSGRAALDAAGQKSFVASLRQSQAAVKASLL